MRRHSFERGNSLELAPAHDREFVLVGGAGFLGSAIARVLHAQGLPVTIVDQQPPPEPVSQLGVNSMQCDFLTGEITLPKGEVVILFGTGNSRPRWPWRLALECVFTTARLLPALQGRSVTLLSSVEVYGSAAAPLTEQTKPQLPWSCAELEVWCDAVRCAARQPCPPWRVAALCRELAAADPSGRWVYALAKLAQEELIRHSVAEGAWSILRLATTFGIGEEGLVTRLIRRARAHLPLKVPSAVQRSFISAGDVGRVLAARPGRGILNVGRPAISIGRLASTITEICDSTSQRVDLSPAEVSPSEWDGCGVIDTSRMHEQGIHLPPLKTELAEFIRTYDLCDQPLFAPPLPVVIPPRPAQPDQVADRQQSALWSGRLKSGNQWTRRLQEGLRTELQLTPEDELLLTTSGTEALRLALVATAGVASPGQVAILPSFTYPATAEVLLQLGYTLRYVDVDPQTWTLSPAAVQRALAGEQVASEQVGVVVCVDTFGNPCDYQQLKTICAEAGVPLVADSAASIGSRYQGCPVGTQAGAHAFSMSFAKLFSSGGAGGAVVLRGESRRKDISIWQRSALMDELHAIAGLDQLAILPDLVARRSRIAEIYASALAPYPQVTRQVVVDGNRHSYVHWVMCVPNPHALAARLSRFGVETRDYFRALHMHGGLTQAVSLPVTEALDAGVIAIPMSSEMTDEQAEDVVFAVEIALAEISSM